jgi:hypothetical protein
MILLIFVDVCRWIFSQLEEGIKRVIRSPLYDELQSTAKNHQVLRNKVNIQNLPLTDMIWLIQLCTEYWKDTLVKNGFLISQENYWYHNFDDPYSNSYLILQYTREIRNLAGHREGSGKVDIIQRLSERLNELEKMAQSQNLSLEKKNSYTFQIQTVQQTKRFYEIRNYDAVENTLYNFLATILQ